MPGKSREIYAVAVKEIEQLVFGVYSHQRSNQCSSSGTCDDPRQQASKMQRFYDTEMT